MTASNLAIPIGLIILLTFLQVLVPSFLLWNTSKYEDGTAATGKDGMGPRDRMPIVTAIVGRAERAKTNLIESLVMLFPALALALFAGGGTLTLIGVWIFIAARVLYIPCISLCHLLRPFSDVGRRTFGNSADLVVSSNRLRLAVVRSVFET